ncbi:Abi-alpha family protein [Salinisphaera sp. T31B1]|uniref:Abi-alpha family protein n=1 Tax=Salinisphaera sp. T31B1 TaxID=727963 RepID=UPI00333FF443
MNRSSEHEEPTPDLGQHFDPEPRGPLPLHAFHQALLKLAQRPVAGIGLRALRRAENWLLIELNQRLARAGGEPPDPLGTTSDHQTDVDPSEILQALLRASRGTDQHAIEFDFYVRVLRQLNPSQARILVLMAGGRAWPMIHVCAGSLIGGARERVLSFASSVGKEAGVLLRDQVPHFIAHMHSLGLLTVGPERDDLEPEYEILEAETLVRDAQVYITDELGAYAHIERSTIRLSEFGMALCNVALRDDESAPGHDRS